MIETKIYILLGLIFTAWLTMMFIWWRKENGLKDSPVTVSDIEHYGQKAARLSRRGLYWSENQFGEILAWCNKKFSKVFFNVFPDAAPAFAKRDKLVGLKDGPSSYFLKTITDEQKKLRNRDKY